MSINHLKSLKRFYIRGRQHVANCVLTQGFKTFSVPISYVFYTFQGQYISVWIITKVICKILSSRVSLKIAWRAKCGTRAVGSRPLFYTVISPIATGVLWWVKPPQTKLQESQIEITNTINQVFLSNFRMSSAPAQP